MQLTGKEIIERDIIGGFVSEGVQQQGVDVRVESIRKVEGSGTVPKEGKTKLPYRIECYAYPDKEGMMTYYLEPGYYEVTLKESCNIPYNAVGRFHVRSSLVRCGAVVYSGQYDAGYKTDSMGCFLHVINPIYIEQGARIAQFIVTETRAVDKDDLYNGQWKDNC